LNDLLNLADIHLLPQLSDAADLVMPSKLTGMMASGRAIVATAHPGTQLFEALEGRGLATPPGDMHAFVSTLVLLADEPSLRVRLGQAARSYAVSHLDREDILSRFEHSILSTCGLPAHDAATEPLVAQCGKLVTEKRAMAAGHSGDD
jgi:colanic acid biosynthesis glycosyl transferase WcaI